MVAQPDEDSLRVLKMSKTKVLPNAVIAYEPSFVKFQGECTSSSMSDYFGTAIAALEGPHSSGIYVPCAKIQCLF